MAEVVTVGSATIDHIIITDQKRKEIRPGDKVLVKSLLTFTGGGASNSAVALAKLGLKVRCLTKLGDDDDGKLILKEFKKCKIKNLCRKRSRFPTSSSYILVSTREKDRLIYTYKGASNDLRPGDFKLRKIKAKWVYLAPLLGKSWLTAEVIANHCRKKNIPLLFNPSTYLTQQGKRKLKAVLRAATLLVLNKEEAQQLRQRKEKKAHRLLLSLTALGPKTVVITDGPRTIQALHQQKFYRAKPYPARVVDTAGAGDAFSAALMGALIRGHSFPEALKIGAINASSVIQKHGPKSGLLTYGELLRKVK